MRLIGGLSPSAVMTTVTPVGKALRASRSAVGSAEAVVGVHRVEPSPDQWVGRVRHVRAERAGERTRYVAEAGAERLGPGPDCGGVGRAAVDAATERRPVARVRRRRRSEGDGAQMSSVFSRSHSEKWEQ